MRQTDEWKEAEYEEIAEMTAEEQGEEQQKGQTRRGTCTECAFVMRNVMQSMQRGGGSASGETHAHGQWGLSTQDLPLQRTPVGWDSL